MTRNYRDSQQRFHKGRQGRILVPHGGQAGILFTINPMQELRARREAQNYLSGLAADLQDGLLGKEKAAAVDARPPGGTTSGLLAMELAAAVAQGGGRKRPRAAGEAAPAPRFFDDLETSCKGYLLLRVPALAPEKTCVRCHAAKSHLEGPAECGTTRTPDANAREPSAEKTPDEFGSGPGDKDGEPTRNWDALPPHTILIHPLVSHLVERIFRDLHENPRPIFKHCFRMIPVELTCCPTLPEMRVALRKLIELHFPVDGPPPPTPDRESLSEVAFTKVLGIAPAREWPTASEEANEDGTCRANRARKGSEMHKVGFRLIIKNNSNVEAQKVLYLSELQAAFPVNRFIVLPPSHISQKREDGNKPQVEAVVCVIVLHATCIMGVQPLFFERDTYNMHDISAKTLVLANSITRSAN